VLVASEGRTQAIDAYRAAVVGGRIDWSRAWAKKLADFAEKGGTLVLNAAQMKGLSSELLGVRPLGETSEADNARCLSPGEQPQNLSGQMFRYERVEASGAQVLIQSPSGDPLVTLKKLGKGMVVFCALDDFLGEDERVTPFAAHMLAHVFANSVPVKVSGDVEYLVNRTATGWVVTLLNNNGVLKPQQGLAQVDRNASVTATVSLPGQSIGSAKEWISDKILQINKSGAPAVTINIAPGGIAIVEVTQAVSLRGPTEDSR